MSISVSLPSDFISVDAGSTTPFMIDLQNKGTETDAVEITVEGLDAYWFTLPIEPAAIEAGASRQERVLFRPQRIPENTSGSYPFTVVVRSLHSGARQTASAILEIKPFHQLSLDIDPRKAAIQGTGEGAEFELKILNLSNIEHTLQLFASDPDNQCTYTMDSDRVQITPGQEKTVHLKVRPIKKSWVSTLRLFGFNVSARSTTHPTVSSQTTAQLEQRPVIHPIPLFSILLLLILGAAWFAALPHPPKINVFALNKTTAMVGDPVGYSWSVSGATSITINSSDGQQWTRVSDKGEGEIRFRKDGEQTLILIAERSGQTSTQRRTIVVEPAPVIPAPEILTFSADPETVEKDKPITIRYKFNEAVISARIRQESMDLDIAANQESFVPRGVGDLTLTLEAFNKIGAKSQKSITIHVVEPPESRILDFRADPMILDAPDSTVHLEWRLGNTSKATIAYEGHTETIDPVQGMRDITITKTGTITISAVDSNGKSTTKSIKVVVNPAPPPEDNGPTSTPPPTGATTGETH